MPFDVVAAYFAGDAAATVAADIALEEAGTAALADAAAAGAMDLGGGISIGVDGAIEGGTFTGGSGLTGNAYTDAITGLSSGSGMTGGEIFNNLAKAGSVVNLGKTLLGLGAKGPGGVMYGGSGSGSGSGSNVNPADQFLPEANFTYNKVSDNSNFVNPLLFSLAGFGDHGNAAAATDPLGAMDLSLGTTDTKPATPQAFAAGGLASNHPAGEPEFYSEGGLKNMYIEGRGDGTSDDIPAMVANNEFVIPADIVAALGNGSSDAGGSVLDKFVETIREHKHSNSPDELPPQSKGPLEYLASAAKKGHA